MKSTRNRRTAQKLQFERLEDRRLLTVAPHPLDLSALDGTNGFRVASLEAGAQAGWEVGDAGDVNADGFADIIIAAPFSPGSSGGFGAAYVLFGKASGFEANLTFDGLNGTEGFEIRHLGVGMNMNAAAGAGDVNGDGYDDVIVGDWEINDRAGASYVVFGGEQFPGLFDLGTLDGSNGFRLDGEAANDRSGWSVSGAGDVNGDNFDDVIIGVDHFNSQFPFPGGTSNFSDTPYAAYVVLGKQDGFDAVTSLSTIDGTNGFKIEGDFQIQRKVSGAGDINGDGLDDIVVANGVAGEGLSGAHVIFGATTEHSQPIHLGGLNGNNGFSLRGDEGLGGAVSGAGDVNGDGFDDLIIGNQAGPSDQSQGEAFVVFGKENGFTSNWDVATLDGSDGFRLVGEQRDAYEKQYFGVSVSDAGDINADGYDDLIVGTSVRGSNRSDDTGYSYVLFGRPGGYFDTINVADFDGTDGFRIESPPRADAFRLYDEDAGRSVSGAGDVNGDGFADWIVGAPMATALVDVFDTRLNSGASYIVFGGDYGAFTTDVTAELVDGNLQILGDNTANHLRISMEGFSTLRVEGLEGTTINGQSDVLFEDEAITSINVTTGKGADSVIVRGTTPFSPVFNIDTGAGRDFVDLEPGRYDVTTGGGADHVIVRDGGSPVTLPHIDTGKGDDRLSIRRTRLSQSFEVKGDFQLGDGDDVLDASGEYDPEFILIGTQDGGDGYDRLIGYVDTDGSDLRNFEQEINCAEDCFVGGDVSTEVLVDPVIGNILVVKGNDHFDHDLNLVSSALGQITLTSLGYAATINGVVTPVSFNDIARVKVITGSGIDTVTASGLMLSDKLIVNTGLNNDHVQIVGSTLEKLKIDTGGGDDTVLIDTTTVNRRTNVLTEWGADNVTIHDSIFGRKVTLEGGLDDDTLHLLGVNLFNKGLEEDFEQVRQP